MKRFFSMILVLIMVATMGTPVAFAADNNTPYAWTWEDEVTGGWHTQLYTKDTQSNTYRISDRVFLKTIINSDATQTCTLYDMSGVCISAKVKYFDDENKPTMAFDSNGKLYFITTTNVLCRMDNSLSATYSTSTVVAGVNFTLSPDGFIDKVLDTQNRLIDISTIPFTGTNQRDDDPVPFQGNYVKRYAVNGDPEKVGFDAYYSNNVKLTIYAREANVWNQTHSVLLSSSSRGGKFVGIDTSYGVYLNDLNGTVYVYAFGSYKEPKVVLTGETVYYLERNSAGFVTSIVTNKGTHPITGFPTNPGTPSGTLTVRNFADKAMSMKDQSTVVSVLAVSEGYLAWNNSRLKNSYGATKFGITSANIPMWINPDADLYRFNGGSNELVASNVTELKYDQNGCVSQYCAGGSWISV